VKNTIKMTNILFICKWNRFRSNSAEAIFNHLNKNQKHQARSGGLFPGVAVTDDIIIAGKKLGIKITKKQQGLNHKLLMWADKIIIVANDVPPSIFIQLKENDGKEIIKWDIKDVVGTNVDKRKTTLKEIKNRVEKLLRNLNQK
jgi:protein-tyrosine-phosphatase